MNKLLAVALPLCLAVAAFGEQERTAFTAGDGQLMISQYAGPIPVFGAGPSASFDNPALAAGLVGHEVGVRLNDAANPFGGALSYSGRFLENATFGAGFAYFSRSGYVENKSVLTFSSSGSALDAGVNAKFLYANRLQSGGYSDALFTLDFDAGFLWNFRDRFFAGAMVRNLLCTPFTQDSDLTLLPQRGVKLQFGGFPDKSRRAVLFGEVRVDSLHDASFSRWAAGAGVDVAFLADRLLHGRLGFMAQDPGNGEYVNTLLGGLSLHIPLGDNLVRAEYGLAQGFGKQGADSGTGHYLSFYYTFGGREDYLAPSAEIIPDVTSFSPNGDNKSDKINFFVKAEDNPGGSGIQKWAFLVGRRAPGGRLQIIKSFSGTGIPPRIVVWDGRDAGGQIVARGEYFCQLRVADRVHNHTDTALLSVNLE